MPNAWTTSLQLLFEGASEFRSLCTLLASLSPRHPCGNASAACFHHCPIACVILGVEQACGTVLISVVAANAFVGV